MADKENKFRMVDIFWSKEDTEESDGGLIGVSGMAAAGNRRPTKSKKTIKGKKTREVTPAVPSSKKQPVVQNLSPAGMEQVVSDLSKKASLKDLCSEDKQRIANLIKELARLGEEKESVVQVLENERSQFENQVHELVAQQEQILRDRESIQGQLHECQDLLVKYQQLVNQQKHQLSEPLLEPTKKNVQFRNSPKRNTYSPDQSYTSENAKGVPTRKEYRQEVSRQRYDSATQQHTNYKANEETITEPRHPHSRERQLSEQVSSHHPPAPSDNQQHGPDTDRPFTSMIDRLIADERNRSSRSTDDRELRLGPLSNPQFESTQVNNTQDFHPLQPDRATPQLSDVNSFTPSDSTSVMEALAHPQCVSTPARKARAALIPEGLSDTEFMEYYQRLTPADRKKQLFVQKQALLEEQERLKKVLAEQESLLEKKHVELRRQQDIQKERLNYFERTGNFPTHFSYSSESRPDSFNFPNSASMNASEMTGLYPNQSSSGDYTSMQRQPFMPIAHAHPQQQQPMAAGYYGQYPPNAYPVSEHQMFRGIPPQHAPVYGMPPYTGPPHTGYGLPLSQQGPYLPRYGDAETASQSTKDNRSACTSPMTEESNAVDGRPARNNRVPSSVHNGMTSVSRAHDERKRNHHYSSRGHDEYRTDRPKVTAKPSFSDLRDERAAHLLDLVDEVESLHNRSVDSGNKEALSALLVPSRKEKCLPPDMDRRKSIPFGDIIPVRHSNDRQIETDEEEERNSISDSCEDLEESQVLEDVFFIK